MCKHRTYKWQFTVNMGKNEEQLAQETVGRLLVNSQPTVDQQLANSRPTVDRLPFTAFSVSIKHGLRTADWV